MRRGRVVIEHQQNTGNEQHQEKNEGDGAEIIGRTDAQRFFPNLDWQPMQKEISEDREAARPIRVRWTAAKDGLPDFRFPKALQGGI
jgi:hypothetical protein